MKKATTGKVGLHLSVCALTLSGILFSNAISAQSHTCPVMVSRNNGNGGSTTCPGVNSTAIASDVIGTSYTTVPSGSKTADIVLRGSASDPWYSAPPVIIAVYTTSNGTSTAINTYPGPPGAPSSGDVKYCSYTGATGNGNMPNSGIVTIRFATPTNVSDHIDCSYNFSSSNSLIANPASIVSLPVHFYSFDATVVNKSVFLEWATSRDKNANRFVVERSINGTDFSDLISIPATQASAEDVLSYSYTDYSAIRAGACKMFYRIREIDVNGTETYSQVILVNDGSAGESLSMAIQGNTLVIKSPNGPGLLQYITIDGRVQKEQQIILNEGATSMNVDNIPNLSFVRLITNNQVCVCRF